MESASYTLYELNRLIRARLESAFDDTYWVQGELSDASSGYGGHFYGELVQKEEHSDRLLARARVNCWARTFSLLHLRFRRETGSTLSPGMQVRLLVRVTFHEQYGYALNIVDIDSTFTLGDMARRRHEILAQLEADGIIHDNQQLPLPLLTKRVAVISAAGAAGYGDFCNQLEHNEYGFVFFTQLFPAVMQGEHVPESVIAALEEVATRSEDWDVVVIIRGGGATSDLSGFDSYPLAACIAQFPLPVVVGIGHERDVTVLDYVAHTRVKTPTAAAAFLIEHTGRQAVVLDDLNRRLSLSAKERIQRERLRLERLLLVLPHLYEHYCERQSGRFSLLAQRLETGVHRYLETRLHRQELLLQRIQSADPKRLLERGFSLTYVNERLLRVLDDVKPGDRLTTHVNNGIIISIIESCKKN